MHDPRAATALRQLADLGIEKAPSPWRWSVVNLESIGRIVLPVHARQALARSPGDPEVRARSVRVAWLLTRGRAGVEAWVDRRGRVYLPPWLRSLCGDGEVLVATRSTDGVVVVASTRLLDGFGDRLAGPVA